MNKTIKNISLVPMLIGSFVLSPVTSASVSDFEDFGYFTRDTISGLDWYDVTATVNMSFNDVTAQLASGGTYDGWRYATGAQFIGMVNNFAGTNIDDTITGPSAVPEGLIDSLHILLGSTLDASYHHNFGQTYDAANSGAEGEIWDYTSGIIADGFPGATGIYRSYYVATINDNDKLPANADTVDKHSDTYFHDQFSTDVGSYIVRTSPVPVPAAVWLMGSGLLGLMGWSRNNKARVVSA